MEILGDIVLGSLFVMTTIIVVGGTFLFVYFTIKTIIEIIKEK